MSSPSSTSMEEKAYGSLMRGIEELDLTGPAIPCDLVLTGDHAFPLAMNSHGQVIIAASLYGSGRIVVFGHESYMSTQPNLVKNAINWLKEGKSQNATVGVHANSRKVEENLKSCFRTKVMNDFGSGQGVGVYVTDAYSVGGHEKNIVAFMKSGGGVLIGGQAWHWASQYPKHNTLLLFPGNRVAGVAGIHFSKNKADAERLPVYPEIPTSWMSVSLGEDFEDDLNFLLQGISEIDLRQGIVASEIMIHGSLAFPIGTTPDGRAFLAGAYYGQGRVVLMSHEGPFKWEVLKDIWNNALHWLDEGRQGVVGVDPSVSHAFDLFQKLDLRCEMTPLREDLSVYVCNTYNGDHVEEIQQFVAEGGGLLIGGHSWHWASCNKEKNSLTEYSGNKILNKMGLTLLENYITEGLYKPPVPSQLLKDHYHFRQMLHKFAKHVTSGDELTQHEEEWLSKLKQDCTTFLQTDANDRNYTQIHSTFTEIIKKVGMPQVCVSCPVKTEKEQLLLHVGTELYKTCPDHNELMPYLIKDIPLLPVVYNHKISVNVDTGDGEEWVSTGLYLTPGMKTYMSIKADIVDKGWEVQIGCQKDTLCHKELKRAPAVCRRFKITSEMMLVHNLWGGLIYLVAPPETKVSRGEVIVQMAVPAPYYKSGVTTEAQWQVLRTAPAPWAELEFENIIFTMSSDEVRDLDNMEKLTKHWGKIMMAIADLAVIPHKFRRKERFVCDVQISHGWMHCGYPVMAHSAEAASLVNVEFAMTKGLWGPIHELGHNQQRACWEFPHYTTECTCNLWSVYVHETVFGRPREKCDGQDPKERRKKCVDYVKNGRDLKNWTCFVALETYIQLVDKFTWDSIKKVFAVYHKMDMKTVPDNNDGKMNLWTVTFSKTVGRNLSGFFKAWGWPITADTEKKLARLPAWTDHPMAEFN